ncbi:MAG: bifunctional methylenetetrahydrofolate dehydrogenase/methenyltetrahydrofolate cyclohydrolase FolD [Alphaproteobacteria bacterium]|nr:bifunctional methylenetetrahydrofolate dehydrogenase/methenyltetrahydrofolate cyclohydrolase FolD [Alphaproteobacteria bacterium]MDE2042396.1 bifunctional methylenetetrahydrofolate dehydrogenase/methenyltetrahydrofolate cyclohydrolase FolD [Alphaproteobacteria bacterium]MDE2340293.1 bifunctional methylenetetrahydrofolate dehydrogenase/methenyltetrahydrofolate cyclohydrolase FolD [Alphaproteobacteria bacterium]
MWDTGMKAEIIDGKAYAASLRARIAQGVTAFQATAARVPGLAVVLVGEDPASKVYVGAKEKQTIEVGMVSFAHRLPADTTQTDLIALIARLNADPKVDGILVQLPLPKHLNELAVVSAIDPDKDVDGLHVVNAGRLASGLPGLVSCTPLGCMMLIHDALGADLSGKNAVVIGRSILVGKPVAQLLLAANCTVTIAHSRTADLPAVVKRADIVVAAVGRAQMVKAEWIKPGACVIDVGINRVPAPEEGKTKLAGDVDFEGVAEVAGSITPVPGGVGPMTIACLLHNTLQAAQRRESVPEVKPI